MLDPETLRAFIVIAEEGHFGRAADRLGVAQSIVSKRLARLEDKIGTKLLTRGQRRKIAPTREGREFLTIAQNALAALEQAAFQGRRIASGDAGLIRIAYVFSAIVTGVLPKLIRRLHDAAPGVELSLLAMDTPEQIAAIANDRIDIALIRPRPSYPEGVSARLIHREGIMIAMPGDHLLVAHDQIFCAELAGSRFIVPQFREDVGLIDMVRTIARVGRFDAPPILRTADFISSAGLAAAGMGIALAPASWTALTLEGLVWRSLDDHPPTMDLMLLKRDDLRACCTEHLIGMYS